MTEPQATPTTAPPSSPRPRWGRRILIGLASAIVLLVLVLAGSALYLLKTESGARLAWSSAQRVLDGKLSGQLLGGTVADGLRLRDVHYQDAQRILDIDRIDADWHLSPLARKFTLRHLRLGAVKLDQQPTPSEPSMPPRSLRLPLALDIGELSLAQLHFTQGTSTLELAKLKLHGQSDGVQHTVVLDSLSTPYGDATAMLHLNGDAPFAIGGGLELSGQYQNAELQEKYHLAAQLSGSLQQLGIALKASGDRLDGSADIVATPLAPVPLQRAQVDLRHINPQAFNAGLPQADLQVRADLAPVAGQEAEHGADQALRVAGSIAVSNAKPGPLDRQLLPLLSARAKVTLDLQQQAVSDLDIRLPKNARIEGGGQFSPGNAERGQALAGQFKLRIAGLDLNQIHGQLKPTQLAGPLDITLAPDRQDITLALDDRAVKLRVDSSITPTQVQLRQARLAAGKSVLEAAGTLDTTGAMHYAVKGKLSEFDPTAWLQAVAPAGTAPAGAAPVAARINMDFDASGAISPQLQLKLGFAIHDSRYANLPMGGRGTLQLAGTRLLPSRANLQVAGNTLELDGSFGNANDRLNLKVDAPQLQQLGYGLSGLLRLDGQLGGSLQRPTLQARYQAEQLAFGAHRLQHLSGQADIRSNLAAGVSSPDNRLALSIDGQGYRGPQARLDKLSLKLDGTYADHTLALRADGRVLDQPLDLAFDAHGQVTEVAKDTARRAGKKGEHAYGWRGTITRLDNQGFPRVALGQPLALELAADQVRAGSTRLTVDRTIVELKQLSWQQGRMASAGQVQALDVGRLLELAHAFGAPALPIKSDLVLDADWDFTLAEQASGHARIARKSGDLRVASAGGEAALGLSQLRVAAQFEGQGQTPHVQLNGRIDASRVGTIELGGTIGLVRVQQLLALTDASPLAIKAGLEVPELKRVGDLIGPQVSLSGKLAAQLAAGGNLGQPRLSGSINGDQLAVTQFDQGIQLKDGVVRVVMDDNVIDLRQIEFHGGQGTLRAAGKVQLGASNPDLDATITADRLELFASPDRRLMLSGQGKIANVNDQLRIDGRFTVDHALFDLPKSSAPRLGDDVVVIHRDGKNRVGARASSQEKLEAASEKPASKFAPVMNVVVDLGNDFRFRGNGADLLLRGDLTVRSEPLSPLRASGTITAEGTYEAFGTKLAIERGIINFQGPIANPNINILAMRRNQDVEAGVSVTGNANQPRVQLVSEPNVPDDEKLSWMMFGHGADSSNIGQRNASSQALALVGNMGGKRIAKDIGLDQFSIGSSESGLSDDQVVNLGKSITEKIMLGYEQSLQGAASVAKLTWQFSRRWSAVVRAGTINGLNVLFNLRYD